MGTVRAACRTLLGVTTVSSLGSSARRGRTHQQRYNKRILMILLPLGASAVVINESNMMDVMFLIGAKSNDSKQLELDI